MVATFGRGGSDYSAAVVAAKCFTAVSDTDVNIEMISFGTSTAALYFLVREEKLDVPLKALHDIFFD